MNKSILALLLIPAFGVLCAAETPTDSKIKVGIAAELTGEASTYGQDIRDAVTFANEKLGQGRYELIFEDEKCTAKDSVTVARKFIDVDKVDFVVGYGCSGAALAAAPLFEKAKIPMLISAATSPKISDSGDYIFRTSPSDHQVIKVVYDYIIKHHKKFGFLSEQTQFAQDVHETFASFNTSNQLDLVSEDYLGSSADLRTPLLKLRTAGVDGLFLNPQAETGLLNLLQEVRRMQWNVQLYSIYFIGSSTFLGLAKEQADGMRGVDLPPLSAITSQSGQTLLTEFTQRFGHVRSYDAIFPTTFEAFRSMDLASRSGKDPRAYLYSVSIDGLLGPYHFDQNGDIIGINAVMKEIKNGKAVVVSE